MGKETVHPAFGVLQVTRSSGGPRALFGTSLQDHRSTINLRLFRAFLSHEHGRDQVFPQGQPFVEVEMSALQFTDMITSLNLGAGVPCTIRSKDGQRVANPPSEETERDRIRDGFQDKANKLAVNLGVLSQEANLLASKTPSAAERKNLAVRLAKVLQELQDNLPFLVEQFEQATNRFTAGAKSEVEAYMTDTMLRAGIRSLGATEFPVCLPEGSDSK